MCMGARDQARRCTSSLSRGTWACTRCDLVCLISLKSFGLESGYMASGTAQLKELQGAVWGITRCISGCVASCEGALLFKAVVCRALHSVAL
jgi:hypothetical protein